MAAAGETVVGEGRDIGPRAEQRPRPGSAGPYVAIITDGNGRWARAHGVPVNDGHSAGADTVKARLRDAAELGVEELTVLFVLDGELVAPGRGGAGPDGHVLPADRHRNSGAASGRGSDALHRPTRGRGRGLCEQDELGRELTDAEQAHNAVRRVQLRRARGDPRRRAALPGRRRGGVPRGACMRRRCTTPT